MPHIFLVSLLCARAPRPRGPHGSRGVRRPLSSSIGAQLPAPCSSSLLAPRYHQTSRNARACGVADLTAFSLELPADLSVQAAPCPCSTSSSQAPGHCVSAAWDSAGQALERAHTEMPSSPRLSSACLNHSPRDGPGVRIVTSPLGAAHAPQDWGPHRAWWDQGGLVGWPGPSPLQPPAGH